MGIVSADEQSLFEQFGFCGSEEEQGLRFCSGGIGWEGITTGTRIAQSTVESS